MFFVFVIFALILLIGLTLIIIDTIRGKGIWGINFSKVVCPNCSEKMPQIRQPQNTRQALCGGWTCSFCGCEMNNWGKEIITTAVQKAQIKEAQENFIIPFDEKGKTPIERVFDENKN